MRLNVLFEQTPINISVHYGKLDMLRKNKDYILNKWKNQGRNCVMDAMKELTDLGYEELAQL